MVNFILLGLVVSLVLFAIIVGLIIDYEIKQEKELKLLQEKLDNYRSLESTYTG